MIKETFTLFWNGPFSQWEPSTFKVEGQTYCCAEQYMMAQKALLFNDSETHDKIMKSNDPKDIKKLGRLVKDFNKEVWELNAKDIVYKGNVAKFSQNESLKKEILKTSGTTLVEASPYDTVWGIGLAEDNPDALDRTKWKGTNWLGEVLTKVRDNIELEHVG